MALSNVSTHKVACILAPIDIPKTAAPKQLQIAASGASNAAICAPKIVYTISSLINPYCMLVIRATVSTWLVWANISTGWIFSALYPSFSNISISLARVAGLQDT